jgi:hypothetical protein
MSSSDPFKALLMQHFLKDLTIMLSGMAFHAADTHSKKILLQNTPFVI